MHNRIRHFLLLISIVALGFSCNKIEESEVISEVDPEAAENYLIEEYIMADPAYFSADTHQEAVSKYYNYGVYMSSITPEEEILKDRKISYGDSMHVTYTGWVMYGDIFDSNALTEEPFPVLLGKTAVIEGWNVALFEMHEKQEARVIIPSQYGYGTTGTGTIAPNATLIFDIRIDSLWTADEQ